ncbi:MAG: FAD-dependent oxidoreductase [Gammaproteobacteria bacterium]|nr:FAD-dependent oxidoreductase [Gammaproteobacteria bacterium]
MPSYVKTCRYFWIAGFLAVLLTGCGSREPEAVSASDSTEPTTDADVIVIGAGLAGLSAAIDAASAGARVLVIDMNSVFGGHGIQSGGVAFINSTMQEELGYEDDPDVAYDDWMEWTVDGHSEWNRFYVENSREMLWDWLTGLGVRFDRIRASHGNSVPRFHMTHRRGLNLTRPIFLEALRYSNIDFRWNAVADHLTKDGDRVVGVEGLDYRTGSRFALRGETVILATGGFQSNIDMVKANWRSDLPAPGSVYSMSGHNSRGSGHRMAEKAGAALVNLDRQYNGYTIVPDMLGLDEARGYYGGNARSIWVNSAGERFVTEGGIDRYVFEAVMREQPEGHWAVYDADDKDGFRLNGPHFVSADAIDHEKIQRLAVENPDITHKADTLADLAARMGVASDALEATVARYNSLVENGESTDIDGLPPEGTPPVFTIDTPPYYATKLYPMANKSAGGISIDMQTRALDDAGNPVPGLYAAGEITGSAGMNGLNGLDGMFTGPSILTGRVAGQAAAAELAELSGWQPIEFTRREADWDMTRPADSSWAPVLGPADIQNMLAETRDGYWHFERVHNLVLERSYDCTTCHSERVPFYTAFSREDKAMQTQICEACHLAPASD